MQKLKLPFSGILWLCLGEAYIHMEVNYFDMFYPLVYIYSRQSICHQDTYTLSRLFSSGNLGLGCGYSYFLKYFLRKAPSSDDYILKTCYKTEYHSVCQPIICDTNALGPFSALLKFSFLLGFGDISGMLA